MYLQDMKLEQLGLFCSEICMIEMLSTTKTHLSARLSRRIVYPLHADVFAIWSCLLQSCRHIHQSCYQFSKSKCCLFSHSCNLNIWYGADICVYAECFSWWITTVSLKNRCDRLIHKEIIRLPNGANPIIQYKYICRCNICLRTWLFYGTVNSLPKVQLGRTVVFWDCSFKLEPQWWQSVICRGKIREFLVLISLTFTRLCVISTSIYSTWLLDES